MITSIGALRLPLQGAIKSIPARLRLETPHASIGALRTIPRYTRSHPRGAATSLSAFSTRATHLDPTQSQRKSDPNYFGSKAFGTPLAMSFESLGIRKNTQLLVILVLTVGAMLEALLWGEKAWIWWKGEEGDRIESA